MSKSCCILLYLPLIRFSCVEPDAYSCNRKVKWANRRAGDAVFFGGKCDCENNPAGIHHVGLMMNDGWDMWNALKTGTRIRHDNFKNWDESPCPYVIRFS